MDHILISLDTGEAGSREYNEFWKKYFPKSCLYGIPIEYGKDQTEAMLKGIDLYKWYLEGVETSKKMLKNERY